MASASDRMSARNISWGVTTLSTVFWAAGGITWLADVNNNNFLHHFFSEFQLVPRT
jgi:hypothetical protein